MTMTARFWRYASFLVRADIAVSLAIGVALLTWAMVH
jgi:hypothetical protein